MYKTVNGLSPAIRSFQNVKDIHQYQTRSATNGNLYISNVNTLAGQYGVPKAKKKILAHVCEPTITSYLI